MYLKITNPKEDHHGLQYHDGLIVDPNPFQSEGSCVAGGIYFTDPKNICKFLNYGIWLREVTIPEGAEMVKDPDGDKWRASQVILGARKDLREASTWEYLVSVGANVHAGNDEALQWASRYGQLEVVKYLVSVRANVHARDDEAIRLASARGYLEVVEYLKSIAT